MRAKRGSAMPELRFDRLFTLSALIFLLARPRAARADPSAEADKPRSNLETGNPPAEADTKPATEQPAGSDRETTLVPLRGAVPAASDTAGPLTGRNTTVESSERAGGFTPALVPDPVPTGKTDQPVTDPAAAGMQTPTPPAATPNANQPIVGSSSAAATPDSERPIVDASPAAMAPPAAAASPSPDQPGGDPSAAVADTPVPTPTSQSDQPVLEPSPTGAATPTSPEPKPPAAAEVRSDNPAGASAHPPAP